MSQKNIKVLCFSCTSLGRKTLYINRGNAHILLGDTQANSGNQQLAKENQFSAIKDYSDAIRLKPSASAYMIRGNARCRLEDAAGAIKDYEKAADLSLDEKGDRKSYQPALIAKDKIRSGEICN